MELDQNFDEENDLLFLKNNEKFLQTMNSTNYFTNSSNKSIGFNYRYNEDTNFEQEEQNKK